MKRSSIITIVIIAIVVIVGIVWWAMSASNSMTGATTASSTAAAPMIPSATPPPSATTPPVLQVMTNTTLGNYLAATNGMTLYTSSGDAQGVSNCTGACATAWPPYTISATQALVAGANINGTLATISRDGTLQVTYNGMPLYFWSKDVNPGDTTGQGVGGFSVAKP